MTKAFMLVPFFASLYQRGRRTLPGVHKEQGMEFRISHPVGETSSTVSHVGTIRSFAHILVTVSRCFVTVGAQFVANTANRIPFLPRTLLDRESQRVSLYVAITATSSREHILV